MKIDSEYDPVSSRSLSSSSLSLSSKKNHDNNKDDKNKITTSSCSFSSFYPVFYFLNSCLFDIMGVNRFCAKMLSFPTSPYSLAEACPIRVLDLSFFPEYLASPISLLRSLLNLVAFEL
jgi:hypothetical protein